MNWELKKKEKKLQTAGMAPTTSQQATPPTFLMLLLLLSFPFASFQQGHRGHAPAAAAAPLEGTINSSQLVAAFFVIGDSTVDCGTNNHLSTFARADRLPYGRDFDTHLPTGRFSNGRVVVDYLAQRLGLPFVPPFLGLTGGAKDMIRGLNYASAASGILTSSGSDLGSHISLEEQMVQVKQTIQTLAEEMGAAEARDHVTNSLFYVSIGSNDFIHYYLANVSGVQSLYLPWNFNRILVKTMENQLRSLYEMNARRIIVMGIAPIGCTPYYLWRSDSVDGQCVENINNMVILFNQAVRFMVGELNHELRDVAITFCDTFQASMDIMNNSKRYGFDTVSDACCGAGQYGGMIMCLVPGMACQDASKYVWWDEFHPTDAVNRILADDVWSGEHASICYPMNLRTMISSKV